MKRLSTLLVSHTSAVAGAERVLVDTAVALRDAGHGCIVATPDSGPLGVLLSRESIESVVVPAINWLPFQLGRWAKWHWMEYARNLDRYSGELRRLVVSRSVDVVYTSTSVILHGAHAAALEGKPHVHHIHEFLPEPGHSLRLPADSWKLTFGVLSKLSNILVLPSERLARLGRFTSARSRVIPYGFAPRLTPATDGLPTLSSHGGPVRIGILGAVNTRKGAELLPDIVRRVRQRCRNVTFTWTGPKDDTYVQGLRERLGDDAGVVSFPGFRQDPETFLTEIDVLLHPAYNETLPRVLFEAGLAGVPAVATDCGGTQEIVRDGVTGFVRPVGDAAALAEALCRLIDSAEVRANMGRAARAEIDRFSLGRYGKAIVQVLEDAAAEGPRRGVRLAWRTFPAAMVGVRLLEELKATADRRPTGTRR